MKIGNGSLKIGIVGYSYNGELSMQQLKELAKRSLNFYPLGEIFNLDNIEIMRANQVPYSFLVERKEDKIRSKGGLDIIAIVSENGWSRISQITDGIIYSDIDSIELAHELGHILGLKHFKKCCGEACGNENHVKNWCSDYLKYIMCGRNKETEGFYPDNIKKLETWLK